MLKIVYAVSDDTKWTPKHIGLGSTLHQVTHSKHLVQLLNRAGQVLSYEQVLKLDTALAESTRQIINMENGAVVPPSSRILQPTILITILRLMVKTPSTLLKLLHGKEVLHQMFN